MASFGMQWFAERADVILLFFDPDKPVCWFDRLVEILLSYSRLYLGMQGTTGETLACMTNSLVGLDHKLHIIMNKVGSEITVLEHERQCIWTKLRTG